MERSELKNSSSGAIFYALPALFLFALSIRFLPFNEVFHGGKVYLFDGDCYVHIRKILLHLRNFPSFVTFDPFEGFPVGTDAIWPPLLDFFMATAALIFGLGDPTVRQVETTAAFLPPLFGGGAVVAAFFFVKKFFRRETALLSALILALMPTHIIATVVGRPDNEMTEPLMTTLLFICFILLLKAEGRLIAPSLWTALAALATLFFWRGATLWIALMAAASLADMTALFLRGEEGRKWRAYSALFLSLSLVLSLFCYFNLFGNQSGFRFNIISWFHVASFFACAAAIASYGLVLEFFRERGYGPRHLFAGILLISAGGAVGMLAFSHLLGENIATGLGIIGIGETDPWIDSISQYGSLRSDGLAGLSRLPARYGWGIFYVPFFFLILILNQMKEGIDRVRLFFLLLMASTALLTLLRQRFDHIFSLFVAISTAHLITVIYDTLKTTLRRERLHAALPTALMALLLIHPLARFFPAFASTRPGFSIEGPVEDAMLWLKEQTPSAGDPYDGSVVPAYSVMARWDYAGWIEYLAERPVVATLYGFETFGLKESAAFHLAEEEAEAEEILKKVGARYVLITKTIGALQTYAGILGRGGEGYTRLVDLPGGEGEIYRPGPKYYDLVATRLLMADGRDLEVGPVRFEPLHHFRLVYESKERMNLVGFPEEVKRIKIFEYLPGAKLTVKARHGMEGILSATVRTNRGRVFEVTRRGVADGEGALSFLVPYPSGETVSGWRVAAGESQVAGFSISEQDVRSGKKVEVRLFKTILP